MLTTGRVVYHWHTRTKTARSHELNAAEPDVFLEIGRHDAAELGIQEGDLLRVSSEEVTYMRRRASANRLLDMSFYHSIMVTGIGQGLLARCYDNELTLTASDPISKPPHSKFAAVRIEKVED